MGGKERGGNISVTVESEKISYFILGFMWMEPGCQQPAFGLLAHLPTMGTERCGIIRAGTEGWKIHCSQDV